MTGIASAAEFPRPPSAPAIGSSSSRPPSVLSATATAVVMQALNTRTSEEQTIDWLRVVILVQGEHGAKLLQLRGTHSGRCNLLHKAVDCRRADYVALLLARGADCEAEDALRSSALLRCASRASRRPADDIAVCATLLRAGAFVDVADAIQRSPLHRAAEVGNAPIVRLLAANGADVNRVGGLHRTALHAAALGGHAECVTALLEYGADPWFRDELQATTALDVAIKYRRWDVVESLKQVSPPPAAS
jgi:ankyrin repeat protein